MSSERPTGKLRQEKLRVGVLASGRGSNLQAIIDAIDAGRLDARITVVLSNKKDAQALDRARRHNLTDVFLDPKPYAGQPDNREVYDRAILDVLRKHDVELVLLAGYMKIVTSVLIKAYENRMMNIHPSLLPAFPGLEAQKKALESGVRFSGCTVHFVTEEVDEGPIILQAVVPVEHDDTPETLAERILSWEHKIYPRAVELYTQGRLKVEGRRVHIMDETNLPFVVLRNSS
jgi:phosphoribosylglycinamide formyltransferase-1